MDSDWNITEKIACRRNVIVESHSWAEKQMQRL